MVWGARFAAFAGAVAVIGAGFGVQQVVAGGPAEPVRLERALPGEADLPDGFGRLTREAWPAPLKPPKGPCRRALSAITSNPDAGASASFIGKHVGESGGVQFAAFDDGLHLDRFDTITTDLRRCEGWGDFSASEMEMIDIGDAAEGARWEGSVRGIPYDLHLVVARTGRHLVLAAHGASGRADRDATEHIVRTAVHKLNR